MKHLLLGTTALMAAGLIVGQAQAADPVKLGLGGYYRAAAGGTVGEDGPGSNNTRSHSFEQDVEVHIKGETVLDNGITVGARIELEGQTSGDQIDEVWAYFQGGFGEIRFGDDDDALNQLCYQIPTAAGNFGVDSPFFQFANNAGFGNRSLATNTTCFSLSGDNTKIIYFSPSFGGFSFALSYAPDGSQDTQNLSGGGSCVSTRPDNNGAQISEVFSAGVNFATDFNGVSVVVGGGYTFGEFETKSGGVDDPNMWNAYAQVGFGGFTVGAAFLQVGNRSNTSDNLDYTSYGVGVTYGWDAWTVGLGWSHGENETSSSNEDTLNVFQATGSYALGPGIALDAMVGYNTTDAANAGNDYDAWELGVGFSIGF